MLKTEIIYNIRNLIGGGTTTDDAKPSNEQWGYIIDYYRARLLKNDIDKGRTLTSLYYQNLGLVDIKQVNPLECCPTIVSNCILRTTNKIPLPLTSYASLFLVVTLPDGKEIPILPKDSIRWMLNSKFTGREPMAYYENQYVYIVNPPTEMLSYIQIRGIFQDPTEAERFKTCDCPNNNTDCSVFSPFEYEYPIPMDKIDILVKMIAETELRILRGMYQDTDNDRTDNTNTKPE